MAQSKRKTNLKRIGELNRLLVTLKQKYDAREVSADEYEQKKKEYEWELKELVFIEVNEDMRAEDEKEVPTKLKPAQIESMIYGYLVTHNGEIDIEECAEELEISKSDVKTAIRALKAAGRLK